jgi:hypothetical protein
VPNVTTLFLSLLLSGGGRVAARPFL